MFEPLSPSNAFIDRNFFVTFLVIFHETLKNKIPIWKLCSVTQVMGFPFHLIERQKYLPTEVSLSMWGCLFGLKKMTCKTFWAVFLLCTDQVILGKWIKVKVTVIYSSKLKLLLSARAAMLSSPVLTKAGLIGICRITCDSLHE